MPHPLRRRRARRCRARCRRRARPGRSRRGGAGAWRAATHDAMRSRVGVVDRREVPLDAEVPEQGDGGAEPERDRAAGRVRRRDSSGACPSARAARRARCTAGSSRRSSGSRLSLVQMRSVRSRMPRSTRAPPDAQLSISRPGCDAFSSSSSRYSARVWSCTRATALRAAAGVDQIAVVVPLEVGDRVLVEQRVQSFGDVGVGLGVARGREPAAAGRRRQRHPPAQDPVRVRASEVAVGVDHLGLDPEAELHAERRGRDRRGDAGRRGQTSRSTNQSPRPAVSSRRPRNQPSSRTKRSTPTDAAASASAVSVPS